MQSLQGFLTGAILCKKTGERDCGGLEGHFLHGGRCSPVGAGWSFLLQGSASGLRSDCSLMLSGISILQFDQEVMHYSFTSHYICSSRAPQDDPVPLLPRTEMRRCGTLGVDFPPSTDRTRLLLDKVLALSSNHLYKTV